MDKIYKIIYNKELQRATGWDSDPSWVGVIDYSEESLNNELSDLFDRYMNVDSIDYVVLDLDTNTASIKTAVRRKTTNWDKIKEIFPKASRNTIHNKRTVVYFNAGDMVDTLQNYYVMPTAWLDSEWKGAING